MDELHGLRADRRAHAVGFVTGHHDNGRGTRGHQSLNCSCDHRRTVNLRQQLVYPPHSAGLAGGQHNPGDARFQLCSGHAALTWLGTACDLLKHTADAHAG